MRQSLGPQSRGRSPQRGFSLVELMVALALSAFLIGGLTLTYLSGRAAARDAEDLSRVQENMRFVSDHLLRDIRNAGFRDQLTLTFAEFQDIGQAFAEIHEDGSELTVRYAGRSHCAQSRQTPNLQNELTLVTNRYFSDGERLRCAGSGPGNPRTTDLVPGVADIQFELLRPPDVDLGGVNADVCNFDTADDLDTACIGVRITLTFDGRGGDRDAVLEAAFRNVLLDRIYGRD